MTLPEKLQAMEALWEDLSRNAAAFESPSWHGEVLKERLQVAESGQAQFIDWNQAKTEIRQRVP
ncbi:MAG: addiction module protein [Opitutaceae bacterium]|nr:addiction module protein [Opitutaceae bacterium]